MNGIDVTVASHDQAVALLTGIRGEITLGVSRDAASVSALTLKSSLSAAAPTRLQRLSEKDGLHSRDT